jgi:hypothetical protein
MQMLRASASSSFSVSDSDFDSSSFRENQKRPGLARARLLICSPPICARRDLANRENGPHFVIPKFAESGDKVAVTCYDSGDDITKRPIHPIREAFAAWQKSNHGKGFTEFAIFLGYAGGADALYKQLRGIYTPPADKLRILAKLLSLTPGRVLDACERFNASRLTVVVTSREEPSSVRPSRPRVRRSASSR